MDDEHVAAADCGNAPSDGRWSCTQTPPEWPCADIYETEDAYILVADVPGVIEENVQLLVNECDLVIRGTRWSTGVIQPERQMNGDRAPVRGSGRKDDHATVPGAVRVLLVSQPRAVAVERVSGEFCRTLRLPGPIAATGIDAVLQNGIYWARLPKKKGIKSDSARR